MKRVTLDEAIKLLAVVQERLQKEGVQIRFHMTFEPVEQKPRPEKDCEPRRSK